MSDNCCGHEHDEKREHEHQHHGHGCKCGKIMKMKIAYELVMRCYPDGKLTWEQVQEAAERIHKVKHLLKGKMD